jgi:AcrR family transcriptional regulator
MRDNINGLESVCQEFIKTGSKMKELIPLGMISASEGASGERRDAVENRARIREVAERLFAERSVAEVNMAEIAAAAGVGKGTLYRHFANKAELCLSLMNEQLQSFQDAMLLRLRQMTEAGAPKLAQLAMFLDALVHFTDRHSPLLCEVQREGLHSESGSRRPHLWQYWTVNGLLQAAVQSGELPGNLDLDFLADILLAPLMAPFFDFQRQRRGFSPDRVSAGLRALLIALPYMGEGE